jgi:hypothetical protein
MAKLRFTATLQTTARGSGGHFVAIPDKILEGLGGGGRIPVNATFNGLPYRGSIVNMGDGPCLGVLKGIIAEARVAPGDPLDVTIERDSAERTVAVPTELAQALRKDRAAAAAWDKLSYTHRKEHARAIEDARKPETRARRVARALEMLKTPRARPRG